MNYTNVTDSQHNKWLTSSSPATPDLEYLPSLTHFPLSFPLPATPSPGQALLLLPFRPHLLNTRADFCSTELNAVPLYAWWHPAREALQNG